MKNRIFATSFCLALFTAGAALGQSSAVTEADIPFEFHVGKTVLPAGHYTVRPEFASGVLSIRGIDGGVMIRADGIEAKNTPTAGSLVFNRYGDTYFLSKVWAAGTPRGRTLPKSPAELELARDNSPAQRTETVVARR